MLSTIERNQLLSRLLDSPHPEIQRAVTNVALLAGEYPMDFNRLLAQTVSPEADEQQCVEAALDGRLALPIGINLIAGFDEHVRNAREAAADRAYGEGSADAPQAYDRRQQPLDQTVVETWTGWKYEQAMELRRQGRKTGLLSQARKRSMVVADYTDADTNPVMTSQRISGFDALIEAEDTRSVVKVKPVVHAPSARVMVQLGRLHAEVIEANLLLDGEQLEAEPIDASCVGWTRLNGGGVEPSPVVVKRIPAATMERFNKDRRRAFAEKREVERKAQRALRLASDRAALKLIPPAVKHERIRGEQVPKARVRWLAAKANVSDGVRLTATRAIDPGKLAYRPRKLEIESIPFTPVEPVAHRLRREGLERLAAIA